MEGTEPVVPYVSMGAIFVAAVVAAWLLRGRSWAAVIGVLAWLPQVAYFGVEVIVVSATTAPYDPLSQPMSDLGVTGCGTDTYPLADHAICSPMHPLMNWTMAVSGALVAAGALLVRSRLPRGYRSTAAMWLLVVFGGSSALAGVIPADIDFVWHVAVSLPGMVVQVPAFFLLGRSLRSKRPGLAAWSYLCGWSTVVSLALLALQPILELPGGLIQRALYGIVFVWCGGMAATLLRDRGVTGAGA